MTNIESTTCWQNLAAQTHNTRQAVACIYTWHPGQTKQHSIKVLTHTFTHTLTHIVQILCKAYGYHNTCDVVYQFTSVHNYKYRVFFHNCGLPKCVGKFNNFQLPRLLACYFFLHRPCLCSHWQLNNISLVYLFVVVVVVVYLKREAEWVSMLKAMKSSLSLIWGCLYISALSPAEYTTFTVRKIICH